MKSIRRYRDDLILPHDFAISKDPYAAEASFVLGPDSPTQKLVFDFEFAQASGQDVREITKLLRLNFMSTCFGKAHKMFKAKYRL